MTSSDPQNSGWRENSWLHFAFADDLKSKYNCQTGIDSTFNLQLVKKQSNTMKNNILQLPYICCIYHYDDIIVSIILFWLAICLNISRTKKLSKINYEMPECTEKENMIMHKYH